MLMFPNVFTDSAPSLSVNNRAIYELMGACVCVCVMTAGHRRDYTDADDCLDVKGLMNIINFNYSELS